MADRNVKVAIDAAFLDAIRDKTDIRSDEEVIQEALTAFNWAVNEAAGQRFILSANKDGSDVARLMMQSLIFAGIKAQAQQPKTP